MIRPEAPADVPAIHALTRDAFEHAPHTDHTEHFIVDALRAAGALTLSLVDEQDGVLRGHVALSPVAVSNGATGWFGLGPISVLPAHQRRGVGSALMRAALHLLQSQGAAGCVVLGEPGYYGRFGFRANSKLVLPGVPPAYFQALHWTGVVPTGEVSYHPAFTVRR